MATTQADGSRQVKDGTVARVDLNVATSGKAVARKIIAGTNVTITETGADTGTGDVTINFTGGGGGSATVVWGPDFGEGSDNNTFTVGVNVDLDAISVESNKEVGVAVQMTDLVANYNGVNAGVSVNLDLEAVNDKTVGVNVDFDAVVAENDKTVGVALSFDNVNATNDKTVGVNLSGTALGTPFWQSVAKTSSTAGAGQTSIVVTPPSGIANGDLLLAFVGISDAVANAAPVINLPAGWTSVIVKTLVGAAFKYEVRAMWKIASSESGNYTFTWSGSATYATAQIHRINGTDATTPVPAATSDGAVQGVGNPTNPPAPAINPGVANCLIFAYLYHDHLALTNAHTAPASHVERVDEQASVGGAAFQAHDCNTRTFAGSGSTPAVTIVCSETANTDWITLRVAVAPGELILV